jgi:hypothetical protein
MTAVEDLRGSATSVPSAHRPGPGGPGRPKSTGRRPQGSHARRLHRTSSEVLANSLPEVGLRSARKALAGQHRGLRTSGPGPRSVPEHSAFVALGPASGAPRPSSSPVQTFPGPAPGARSPALTRAMDGITSSGGLPISGPEPHGRTYRLREKAMSPVLATGVSEQMMLHPVVHGPSRPSTGTRPAPTTVHQETITNILFISTLYVAIQWCI